MAKNSLSRNCIIEGCLNNQDRQHDMCLKHWTRWTRHADPFWKDHKTIVKSIGTTLEARFWSRVNKDGPQQPHMESNCWLFVGGIVQVYGSMSFEGKQYSAHRLSWELANGEEMPKELQACHRCDVPRCVRPEHIFPGTPLQNMQDKDAKGRGNYTAWRQERPELQPRGERINTAVLTEDNVRDIRRRRDNGEELLPIATDYNITRTQVSRIGLRLQWKHVSDE